jgi:dTDP-4-amino-4,6-dideoxygalactose transaminase
MTRLVRNPVSEGREAVARKTSFGELAVVGGAPLFADPVHIGAPNIGTTDAFLERARAILETRWLSNGGPFVVEFERRIAELIGVEHCVAFCNGTMALEGVARAARLEGEIIAPSFTFVATAHALLWQGLDPVFCDIDETTHNLDPDHVAELITERTTAILGVHLWGRPAYSEKLQALAEKHNLRLFFDAAHAVGCSHQGRPIGSLGDAEILSFHATKVVNSFEGGAALTNDLELAERLRRIRNFGFVGYDEVADVGVNGKMSEIAAAMGLSTLEQLDAFVETNHRNYDRYRQELADLRGVSVLPFDEREQHSRQFVVLELDPRDCPLSRDDLVSILHAENVLARRYFFPGCHRLEPYRSRETSITLPVTDAVAARVVSLPTGSAVGLDDVAAISDIVRLAVENADKLPSRLPELKRAPSPPLTA